MRYKIGIDVGGTFTDFLVSDELGNAEVFKVLSTPRDPSAGVYKGLQEIADAKGLSLSALLDAVEIIVHGTTITTNAVLTGRGAKTGFITYYAERKIDHDGIDTGKLVTDRLALNVSDEEIIYDFTSTDPQVKGFLNSPYPNTVSSAYISLFSTIENKVKINEGSMRPVSVIAAEGSLLNPREPALTTACTVPTCEAITEAGWYALAQAAPHFSQAAWNRWAAPASGGFNPRTGKLFGDIHFMSKGGGGATQGFDGWDHMGTVCTLGGLRAPDPELHEMINPYLILNYEYIQDYSGSGQWRGGNGVRYSWKILADNIALAMFGSGVRDETAPFGLQGGLPALRTSQYLIKPDGQKMWLDVNCFVHPEKGDVIEIYSSGGGGFGDPKLRPVEKVLEDVENELISIEVARQDYGVVIEPVTLQVDMEETGRLRCI